MSAFFISLFQTAGEFLIYVVIVTAAIICGKNFRNSKDKRAKQ